MLRFVWIGGGRMITTKAEVLNYIKEATESLSESTVGQLSAQSVSRALSISRSLASQYLNELYREQYFIKISSRPVLYIHKEVMHYTYGTALKSDEYLSYNELQQELDLIKRNDDIHDLIGSWGSLKKPIDQLKASISYPPFGLALLMIGKEGTGKRSLVESIYKYGVRNGIIQDNKNFQHADFKETSLKQIIENDDQTVSLLYCSNVHMLNESEQMLLLEVVNRKQPYLTSTMIIMSVPSEAKLNDNFLEKVPMKTTIKNFEDRYSEERRALVIRLFQKESLKLKRSIETTQRIIDMLANTTYEGQIKELEKVIRMICAQAHADDVNDKNLMVKAYHVDQYIDSTLYKKYLNEPDDQKSIILNNIKMYDEELFDYYMKIMLINRNNRENIDSYIQYLTFDINYDEEHVEDIKKSLAYLFNVHTLINQQPFFMESLDLIALMIYTIKRNYKFIAQWETVNNHLLKNVVLNTRNKHSELYKKIELVILSIYNYTGIQINTVNEIVLITQFARYVQNQKTLSRRL